MLTSNTRSWLEIHVSRIEHNVAEIQKLLLGTNKIMGIVKANAYGHGDVVCAKELERIGIDFFGVSSVDEALSLREGGISSPILILGYTPPVHFPLLKKYRLTQTILSLEYAKKLNAYALAHDKCIDVHVKLDTGMSRIGIVTQSHAYHIEEVKAVYALKGLHACGIFSHFPVSDDLGEDAQAFTKHQIELFEQVLADLKQAGIEVGLRHIQNSYGILNYPDLDYDYARPGLLWMGITSDDEIAIKTNPDFLPVMEWKANVSLVKTIEKGVTVSYGRHYKASETRRIATLSVGYADGYPRSLSNTHAYVLIHGKRAEIIGNICMDQMMVDVSDIEDVKEGDVATLFGCDGEECLSIDTLSRNAHTINNETLCRISARVPRIYK